MTRPVAAPSPHLAALALAVALIGLATGTSACRILPEPEPPPRWFDPAPSAELVMASAGREGARLRLRDVAAASHLGTPIVVRTSPVEVVFAQDRRWLTTPDDTVQACLARKLFADQGLRRVDAGEAPILDVLVTTFEQHGSDAVVVTLAATLLDARREAVVHAEYTAREATTGAPTDLAAAMARAVEAACRDVTADVVARLP